jgi:sialic acid synthase SpsE
VTFKRPGTGIWPKYLPIVVGKKALENLPVDTILTWKNIS